MNPFKSVPGLSALLLAAVLAAPALAHTTVYRATLTGAAEAPSNSSPGIGEAILEIDNDNFTMRVQASFSGLQGTVTAAHIHCCTLTPETGTAGVASVTPTFTAFPSAVSAGTYDRTYDMALSSSYGSGFLNANGSNASNAFAALLTGLDSGKAYFNIHTSVYGGGEIRGFLMPVPEVDSWALMLGGLGALAAAGRLRRRA